MHVAIESPDQPEVLELIAELDAYQSSLYPPESTHFLDLESLNQANVRFVVARDAENRPVGCGAVVLESDYGELKRMYVHPRGRGQGIAKAVLARLESEAAAAGCTLLKLESGPFQPEALALYARSGLERCGPFGEYWDDPLSVFMQKRIADGRSAVDADVACNKEIECHIAARDHGEERLYELDEVMAEAKRIAP